VEVRVIPEQPKVLFGNFDLIGEGLTGGDVNKHIVAILQR
jgi:hypothetical protein